MKTPSVCVGIDMWQRMARDAVRGARRATASISHLEAGFILVDGDKVTTEIVLPRKGTSASGVLTYMGLESVGVMCSHVSLEVECPCEC